MLALTAETRASSLAAMADGVLDVLVIGGGITGAGVALDAAARGLRVGLVEREDIASGTSGRSSRLIHGGARYLRQAEFGLVRESLRERAILLSLAPHLVRPLSFLLPVPRPSQRGSAAVGLGLYGLLAPGRSPRHRWVNEDEAVRLAPGLARPSGGYVYWDCQTDDARLTLEVIRAAAGFGALVATRSEVEGLTGHGRVTGARLVDRLSGDRLEVRSRITVNATGAWADRLLPAPSRPRLRPSVGVHVVLDRRRIPIRSAPGHPLGTPAVRRPHGHPVRRAPGRALDRLRRRADPPGLGRSDLRRGARGSRRPGHVGRGAAAPEYRPGTDPRPVATARGARRSARAGDRHRREADYLPGHGRGGRRPSVPRSGVGRSVPDREDPPGPDPSPGRGTSEGEARARELGLPPAAGNRLVERFGDDWTEAAAAIADEASLGEPAIPGLPVLRVESIMARKRELALTEEDVLVRRTRLTTMDGRVRSLGAVW